MASAKKTGKKHRGKLFKKYFIAMSVSVLICLLLGGSIIMFFLSNYWTSVRKSELLSQASAVATLTEMYLSDDGKTDGQTQDSVWNSLWSVLENASQASNADVFICDTSGKVLLCRDCGGEDMDGFVCIKHGKLLFSDDFIAQIAATKNYIYRGTLHGVTDETSFIATTGIYYSGKLIGFACAIQNVNILYMEYIRDFIKILFVTFIITTVFSAAFTYIMAYSVTKPLTEMSEMTKLFAKGDFSKRIKVYGNDELAQLSLSFNSMADELSRLENSRASFVANVSHEFRTPMTTIAGFIDTILAGKVSKEDEKRYMQTVSDEVKRLSRLITSMLNLSKIQAGEIKVEKSDFRLDELVITTLFCFEQKISDREIEVTGLDEMPEFTVNADKDMINQVIYNIFDNAVKYTPDGCELNVRVIPSDDNVTVIIRNYGVGLGSDEAAMVFERFYKVDKSRSFDVKSVGLGLYLCKVIVELHGGTIRCDSDGEKYTEFKFTLPK